ncbi:MAG: type II toxin-antitoxin system RelE/ParE family toxin [Acidobacteriaceae bacterium]|nr:type II toxin-antitoxin system RelE/ParE family toxin [Acidobacteriaceae bacterium]
MTNPDGGAERVFKTAWFTKAARKAHIADDELCAAIRQVMLGQADDLGGGVFKKRLSKNLYRSIVLAKGRQFWVYEYLFAKKDRANIADDELDAGCTVMPPPLQSYAATWDVSCCIVIPPPISHESRQPVEGGRIEVAENATLHAGPR